MAADRHGPGRRWGTAVLAAACVAAIAGCSAKGIGARAATPVELDLPAPSYVLDTGNELVVRSGTREARLPAAKSAAFLGNGDVLIDIAKQNALQHFRVLDPASGQLSGDVRTNDSAEPGRSVTRIDLRQSAGGAQRLRAYDLGLRALSTVELPVTDNPAATDKNGLERNYYGVAATVGDTTLLLWHDGSEFYEDGDYGVVRVRHPADAKPRVDNVLLNQRLVSLHLSADGAALLAVRQDKGKPCGGCKKSQSIVEIDPASGQLTDYGHPDGYDKRWRVEGIDRVGDRVAVRYAASDGTGGRRALVGTYVYDDGRWSLLDGSDLKTTWWQDGGRVIARPKTEPVGMDGYTLTWAKDGEDSEAPIAGELAFSSPLAYGTGSIPGQLLPPK